MTARVNGKPASDVKDTSALSLFQCGHIQDIMVPQVNCSKFSSQRHGRNAKRQVVQKILHLDPDTFNNI